MTMVETFSNFDSVEEFNDSMSFVKILFSIATFHLFSIVQPYPPIAQSVL